MTVVDQSGALVDRWPVGTRDTRRDAVDYLALHFRGVDRPVLEAALNRGGLEADAKMGSSTFTIRATVTALPELNTGTAPSFRDCCGSG